MTPPRKPYGRRGLIGTALLTVAATGMNSSATALVAPVRAVAQPAAAAAAPGTARTSALEARRVDSVPTPKLVWDECPFNDSRLRCTTMRVPLDYDDPKGPTVELAVMKLLSLKPKQKIGTLFVNPGGPAVSVSAVIGTNLLGRELEEGFDVVGLEPRGVGYSEKLRCWKSFREKNAAEKLSGLSGSFPESEKEFVGLASYLKLFSQACSKGVPLAGAASTTQYARDLDVLRRAVGDRQLNFLGFSYGAVVGQSYAAMFPDRVRAVAIDGVPDAVDWFGTPQTANQPSTGRFLAGESSYAAWVELMKRCDEAGPTRCKWSDGNSFAKWQRFAAALKAKPLVMGPGILPITYSQLVFDTGGALYARDSRIEQLPNTLQELYLLEQARGSATEGVRSRAVAARKTLRTLAAKGINRPEVTRSLTATSLGGSADAGFPYFEQGESFYTVWCTDALNPRSQSAWWREVAATERKAPYFGQSWLWNSLSCAGEAWTVKDEDVYRGPFNTPPATPMLAVGNIWDPATSYKSAVSVAKRTPGTGLLLSDSWGHTAFGTSECVTSAISTYLLTQKAPPKGTRCVGDYQPFADPSIAAAKQLAAKRAGLGRTLPVAGLAPLQMP